MLEWLKLENVGPAPKFELDFAPRVNLITGDNGLGKSFLLDVAWFALTGAWRDPVLPRVKKGATPTVSSRVTPLNPSDLSLEQSHSFDAADQRWKGKSAFNTDNLVINVQIDGELSVYDSVRNNSYFNFMIGSPKGFLFRHNEIWDGLKHGEMVICNGLIQDWCNWQRENNDSFKQLESALIKMSPTTSELLRPGELTRIGLSDVRDIPTIKMPYGQEIPILHASAGIRRVASLAYALVWTWQEHLRACEITGAKPAKSIVVLVDELEEHLHPRWQQVLLPALLEVIKTLTKKHSLSVQIIAATHSPMVMASLEPLFDTEQDAWFDLNLVNGEVTLEKMVWRRRGDANAWLKSEAFDLPSTYSREAGQAMEKASALARASRVSKKRFLEVDAELRRYLSDTDPFWIRWRSLGENKGWL